MDSTPSMTGGTGTWSAEQEEAFQCYLAGKNVFLTGPGGTGKTKLIQRIKEDASWKGRRIQVCAMTGCAAVLLECGAKTIHSWSGIGLANGTVDEVVNRALKKKNVAKTWRNTDILVVDEVSMMSEKIFLILDRMGKFARHKLVIPFGGIQIIFSGDFFQLPPIFRSSVDEPECGRFCFESRLWDETFPVSCQIPLVVNFRQKDSLYVEILNEIREGRLTTEHADILRQCVGKKLDRLDLIPTQLYPTNEKVRDVNHIKMLELGEEVESHTFLMEDLDLMGYRSKNKMAWISKGNSMETIEKEIENLKKNVLCDLELKLKVGAQVMHIVNRTLNRDDEKAYLCNGAQGVVIGFKTIPRVADGFDQVLKKLGKSDDGEAGYATEKVPIVRWQNGITCLVHYHEWMSEEVNGLGIRQIPLILAWAVSIHKCQGMTMSIAEIDIGSKVFECAQSYVALSRVQTLEGLYLKSFDSRKIRADPRALEFYRSLGEKREKQRLEIVEEKMEEKTEEMTEEEYELDSNPPPKEDPDVKVIDFSSFRYHEYS